MHLQQALKKLRTISIAEGVSYIILLGISMPLKYIYKLPEYVKYNGYLHGILFMLLMVALLYVWLVAKWPFIKCVWVGLLSFIPFGALVADRLIKQDMEGR